MSIKSIDGNFVFTFFFERLQCSSFPKNNLEEGAVLMGWHWTSVQIFALSLISEFVREPIEIGQNLQGTKVVFMGVS